MSPLRPKTSGPAVLAGLLALLLAGGALAQERPSVLVLPYAPVREGASSAAGEKAAALLRNELNGAARLKLATLENATAKKPKAALRKDADALASAHAGLAMAKELIKKLQFKEAIAELEKAIQRMEGQHPYIDFEDLIDAFLNLAVAHLRQGSDSDGEKALAQVVRLDPARALDPEKFPPVFIRTFDGVGKRLKKAPRSSIEVKSDLAGAEVFLDGRQVGRTPLVIKELIDGAHFLRVGDTWSSRVEVAAGARVEVTAELASADDLVAALVTHMSNELASFDGSKFSVQ